MNKLNKGNNVKMIYIMHKKIIISNLSLNKTMNEKKKDKQS